MGPVMYFNSLDTALGARLDNIARRCYCFLQYLDSSRSIHLKLDVAVSTDTTYYQVRYDNLYGDYSSYTDTTRPAAKMYSEAGLYVKGRDSTINSNRILLLLAYGIGHYKDLKKGVQCNEPPDAVSKEKPSLKIRRLMNYCN